MPKLLVMTDRYGISAGYKPVFSKLLTRLGIPVNQVAVTDIYTKVPQPLKKYRNAKILRFDPDKLSQITDAFIQKISLTKPSVILVTDPAILGVLSNNDLDLATLDKMRGGVYYFRGIPCVVSYPITVINRMEEQKLLTDIDGEEINEPPYKVQSGNWIFNRDLEKTARYYHGKTREVPSFNYSVARTVNDLQNIEAWLRDCKLISVDIETGLTPPQITCVGYCGIKPSGDLRAFVIPFYDPSKLDGCFWSVEEHRLAIESMRRINLLNAPKIMHNGAYDSSYFIRDLAPPKNYLLDSMVMWWSIYMELPKSLDFVSSILQDNFQYWKDDIKGIEDRDQAVNGVEQYWRYNAVDCYYTLLNGLFMAPVFAKTPSLQYNNYDAMLRVFAGLDMSIKGIKADFKRRNEHRAILEKTRDEAEAKLRWMIDDPEFNVNSPKQKVSLIYEVLGARPRNARGRYIAKEKGLEGASAGAIALKLTKSDHPIFRRVIESMEAVMAPDKQISNVCDMYLATDRFRTAFNAVGTETTRFSSKKSNFWDGGNAQNIRDSYRDWLVADQGKLLMEVDYSQSDDVFVSYESNDPEKIHVIEERLDAHSVNGELFFKIPYAEIVEGKKRKDPRIIHPTKGIRQISKRVGHGANFLMAAATLYTTMGREICVAAAEHMGFKDANSWDQDKLIQLCGALMGAYRKKYKRLTHKEWYGDLKRTLAKTGKLTNAFGITRSFLGDPEDDRTLREAAGFIGQSDTAGNMNRTANEINFGFIQKQFRDGPNPCAKEKPLQMNRASHGFEFSLQVHDSFLVQFDLGHPKWMEAASNLLHVMERPIIINGHEVVVRTEAEFMTRWKGESKSWNGDPKQLPEIAAYLTERRN